MIEKIDYLSLSREEKENVLQDLSSTQQVTPVILEKDFWVSFCLDKIFSSELRNELIFKGGTSLSKCYGLIDRFSEDVDIGVLPSAIGWNSEKLAMPSSNTKQQKQKEALQASCKEYVQTRFITVLDEMFKASLPVVTWQLCAHSGKRPPSFTG